MSKRATVLDVLSFPATLPPMSTGKDKYERARREKLMSKQTIDFHYSRSNLFRSVWADGVYGGVSPKNLIHMGFFLERNPLPKVVSHSLSFKNDVTVELGPESRRDVSEGFERELQVEVVLTLELAKSLQRWLDKKINELESIRKSQGNGEGEDPPNVGSVADDER